MSYLMANISSFRFSLVGIHMLEVKLILKRVIKPKLCNEYFLFLKRNMSFFSFNKSSRHNFAISLSHYLCKNLDLFDKMY